MAPAPITTAPQAPTAASGNLRMHEDYTSNCAPVSISAAVLAGCAGAASCAAGLEGAVVSTGSGASLGVSLGVGAAELP